MRGAIESQGDKLVMESECFSSLGHSGVRLTTVSADCSTKLLASTLCLGAEMEQSELTSYVSYFSCL